MAARPVSPLLPKAALLRQVSSLMDELTDAVTVPGPAVSMEVDPLTLTTALTVY